MNGTDAGVETIIRIPGCWQDPHELVERLPAGFHLTSHAIVLPNGTAVEIRPLARDDQFADVFRSACRLPAALEEMERVASYTVNLCVRGPGGSLPAARTIMQAGAAVVQAGGAGVFIDNSGLAHGGGDWLQMAEDGGWDAVSFAFVNLVRCRREMRTIGMHVLGLPDIVMPLADADADDGRGIVAVIRDLCRNPKRERNGRRLAGAAGMEYLAADAEEDPLPLPPPMRNPFGQLKLVRAPNGVARN